MENLDLKTLTTTGRLVSTVLLRGGYTRPFETMVFTSQDSWDDIVCRRVATEEDARANHDLLVDQFGGPAPIQPYLHY